MSVGIASERSNRTLYASQHVKQATMENKECKGVSNFSHRDSCLQNSQRSSRAFDKKEESITKTMLMCSLKE